MITQRELDIAQVEAKMKADKLFEEWRLDFLANRAKRGTNAAGYQGADAEDSQAAGTEDYEPVGVGAEGGTVLPAAGY